ncbi:hypothetical protein CYMTET_50841 [Cymbomonas tetramitiformis]|uniref:GCF C-terminal domain-containing protein n=1 Tax=Cymbomonas tetramitiformis TaxID=36881 RepID=A0AAE0BME3_9CHLO|nr:hypothetical protein CYMTET_50841 [Cymbomonas tetramitiformis]
MSAPALFAPFVRLELLHWCPLYTAAPLDGMQWYSQLVDYGMPGPGEAAPAAADLDENLVPEIMRKVVLPIVQHSVDCWDPLSSRQTESLCACMRELLIYVNPEDDVVQELLETAYKRMVSAAEEVVLPSWPPQAMSVTAGASELAARRFGTAVRLIKNLAAWDMDSAAGKEQIIPRQQLIHLAVDNLVAHRMGPHLMTLAPQDAVFRCERLISALPESWFADGLPANAAILRDALVVASRPLMGPGAAARGTDTGRRLMKLLGRVGEHSVAKQVAKAYGI